MSNKLLTVLFLIALVLALADDHYRSSSRKEGKQEARYLKAQYVQYGPRFTEEQILFLARRQARATETRNGRLGVIEPGKKGLITIRKNQDMRVVKACIAALRERGADLDYIYTTDLLEMYGYPGEYAKPALAIDTVKQPELQLAISGIQHYHFKKSHFSEAAWKQLPPRADELIAESQKRHDIKNKILLDYLNKHREYEYIYPEWFGGGPMVKEMGDLFGRRFQFGWRLNNLSGLVREGTLPNEVWRALEQKVLEVVPWIRHARITDPEGTDVEFSITPEDANYWRMGVYNLDYLRMWPVQASRLLYLNSGIKHVVAPEAKGVIAGTDGHYHAMFPHLKMTIEGGQAVKAEGGGLQGVLMNDLIHRFKDYQIPYLPHPGWAVVFHLALTVNPKAADRTMYWAFGPELYIPEIEEYGKKHNVPITHDFHLNNGFITYEVTVTGGKKVKIKDGGHLVALDDPEVRAIASKFGDPEDILGEEGQRPIPGINAPGDYWKDYAQDPARYILAQRESLRLRKSPYLTTIMPFQLRNIAGPQTDDGNIAAPQPADGPGD